MSKRAAEDSSEGGVRLVDGQRPENGGGELDNESDIEDDSESEEEIFEAGVDGLPDDERVADERRGMWYTPKAQCGFLISNKKEQSF